MLGFHLDDNEASLRITFAPAGRRTSLLSLLHAVGFQEEEAKRLLIDALVKKGIPALWIHFDDSTPRQGDQLGALCPWHSASGGIRVIFANEGMAQKMLDRYKDRSFTIDMTVILGGLSPTLQQWVNQHISQPEKQALQRIPLTGRFWAASPRREIRTRVPVHLWPRTVLLYPDPVLAQDLRFHFRTHVNASTRIRTLAREHAIELEQVYVCDSPHNTWVPSRGIALVVPEEQGEDGADALLANLRSPTPTWDPRAITNGTDVGLTTANYHAELAADPDRPYQLVTGRSRGGGRGRGGGNTGGDLAGVNEQAGRGGGQAGRGNGQAGRGGGQTGRGNGQAGRGGGQVSRGNGQAGRGGGQAGRGRGQPAAGPADIGHAVPDADRALHVPAQEAPAQELQIQARLPSANGELAAAGGAGALRIQNMTADQFIALMDSRVLATLTQVGLLVVPPAARLEAPQAPGSSPPRGDGSQPPASHEPGAQ